MKKKNEHQKKNKHKKNTKNNIDITQKIILWLKKNLTATLIGILLSIIGIILSILFWWFPADSDTSNEPFTATIQVYGWESKQHNPLDGKGSVVLTLGSKSEKAVINQQGEAIFKDILPEYDGKIVPIHIADTDDEPYYFADSVIQIHKDKKSKIQVRLCGLEKFEGMVIDENGNGIADARIFVAGVKHKTDERGYFQINIPIEKQQRTQEIEIFKDGYTSYRDIAMQMTGDVCRIVLPFK